MTITNDVPGADPVSLQADELDLLAQLSNAEVIRIDPAELGGDPPEDVTPMRKVWALVLTVAVVDYLVTKPTSRRFREAKDWIFGGSEASNSFDNVARFLDYDPPRLRKAIACRRSEVWDDPQAALSVLAELRNSRVGVKWTP